MKKVHFIITSIAAFTLIILFCIVTVFFAANNKAIHLEEQINESAASIEIQEKRRVDLIQNLVDTVQAYDQHEESTLTKLTEARTQASAGNIESAQTAIAAVAEAYPDLKSQANYQTLMLELATTENLIAEHRNNFNIQVKRYNKHIRSFPNSLYLGWIGYEVIDVTYLEYDAPADAPTNLFGK